MDIGRKAKISILYNIAAKMASSFGRIISTIVLARLLAPEDFGIVGTGMLIIGFATKFGNFGFHQGLIQRKEEITTKHIDTLFTLVFSLKVTLWLIVFFASPFLARYFEIPVLATALPVLALYIVLECFSTTPLTVLKRDIDYKSVSIIDTIQMALSTAFSIIMALLGFGLWSLIFSKLVSVSIAGILAMRKTHWAPRLGYDRQARKDLFRFGIMITLRNLFRYGAENIDRFYVSKLLGVQFLGFYEKAFELMRLPQKRITTAVNKVVFSAFSRIQDEPERIKKAFRKLVLAVSLLSFPLLTGMAITAHDFIAVVLGEKWLPAALPLQIMCAAGLFRAIDPFLNSLLTATGYVKSTVTRRAFEFGLIGVAAYFGVQYGLPGVALAIVLSSVVMMFVMMHMIIRVTAVKWRDYWEPQMPAIATSTGMVACIYGVKWVLAAYLPLPLTVSLLVQVFVGGAVYLGLHFLFRFKAVLALVQEMSGDTRSIGAKLKAKFSRSRIPMNSKPAAPAPETVQEQER